MNKCINKHQAPGQILTYLHKAMLVKWKSIPILSLSLIEDWKLGSDNSITNLQKQIDRFSFDLKMFFRSPPEGFEESLEHSECSVGPRFCSRQPSLSSSRSSAISQSLVKIFYHPSSMTQCS